MFVHAFNEEIVANNQKKLQTITLQSQNDLDKWA